MTASAPAKNTKAGPALRLPPDERFWKRHSPHGEAPLSMAGSITLHALGAGALILFALYLASLFDKSSRSLPVDPVTLAMKSREGGGGNPSGVGPGPGGQRTEDLPDKQSQPADEDTPRPQRLKPAQVDKLKENFNAADVPLIQKSDLATRLVQLEASVREKLRVGLNPGKGRRGPGSDGGDGVGVGPRKGPDSGKATLSKREKRMLRWHMRFTANTGADYLAQLRGLGGILAFPVMKGDAPPPYQVVRDLRAGAKLLDEDLSKIQRIYWIDDKPQSVRDILSALRIDLKPVPAHFVAFLPEELEKKLFALERNYVEKVLRQTFDEDKIEGTEFRVVPTPNGYKPELISVRLRN
jgi:hypothetical protein